VPDKLVASHLSIFGRLHPVLAPPDALAQERNYQDDAAHVGGIKHFINRPSRIPAHIFLLFSSHFSVAVLAMSQLRTLALLLVAVTGGVSAAIGPGATLPIVNAVIAPDGFTRP
jgi:hypothetical protein